MLSEQKTKAIAAEYLLNGLDKTKALISAGYSRLYAERKGKRLFDNVQVIAEIERMRAKTELKTGITIDKVLTDLENSRLGAIAKGDYSSGIRASELQGKQIGMFKDVLDLNSNEQAKALTEQEQAEAARLANIRLRTG